MFLVNFLQNQGFLEPSIFQCFEFIHKHLDLVEHQSL